jgi:hypothetical protein
MVIGKGGSRVKRLEAGPPPRNPSLFDHSVPLSSVLAWPLVPCSAQSDCLRTGYRCTRTHSPRPPPVSLNSVSEGQVPLISSKSRV